MSTKLPNLNILDLVIIGGGPAGMSAALIAGRSLVDTVVVNAESPRNAVTNASHGFFTRDGAHPSELFETAKAQLAAYGTVQYINDTVTSTRRVPEGFEVSLSNGSVLSTRKLVIATGYTDDLQLLGLAGIEAVYGKSVYPCVFCDGFEHRNERLALFGGEMAIHYAPMIRLWSKDLAVFTNGATIEPEALNALTSHDVPVYLEPIRSLEAHDGRLVAVELESGERIERDAGFISDEYSHPTTTFAQSLGVTSSPTDWGTTALDISEAGATNVADLYVVGDAKTGFSGIVAAAAQGAECVESIVHEIATQRWNRA
ncbi:NAD(P)/FAD-dependent oxidoreductase [Salinibacterium sp. M195]|uniref:NAD(P)/FAD-dependent oxidoreductase n=1 Tax=Salinibacterium sp. M195 TaxID=2583374 RepID=UPI001C63B047|nr:NAD(P)/FAD-dependent oxidoreductase [Salinibacterium sp. M195]QYH35990.1 NAD(P)/FAD-dependent oxidoreductase [Salinibacterium sp. M195]